MEKQNKSTGKTALIVLLLLVTIVSLVLATYAWAKYTTTEEGTATAQVAKWNVTADTAELTFSKTFTHVVDPNKLAPGTNGQFSASLDVTGTEVDVAYTITIDSIENKPTNLIIKDAKQNVLAEGSKITGELPVGSTSVSEVMTWDWPYETGTSADDIAANDAIDTADGEAAKTMTITYTITAVQVQPE